MAQHLWDRNELVSDGFQKAKILSSSSSTQCDAKLITVITSRSIGKFKLRNNDLQRNQTDSVRSRTAPTIAGSSIDVVSATDLY